MATPLFFAATALLNARDDELEVMVKTCSKSRTGVYYIPTTGFLDLSALQRNRLVAKLSWLNIECLIDPVGINPEPGLDSETVAQRLLEATSACTEMETDTSATVSAGPVHNGMRCEVYSPELGFALFEQGLSKENRILEAERQAHDALERDGCRPVIPINVLEAAIRDPFLIEGYLRPWNDSWYHKTASNSLLLDDRSVLQRQRLRWRDFRRWQCHNRLLAYPEDESFGAYFAARRGVDEAGGLTLSQDTCSMYVEHVKLAWTQDQILLEERSHIFREKSSLGFDQHVAEVQCHLRRHGCEPTFAPFKDPRQQTELMTWMEYLCFESLLLDKWTASTEQLQCQQQDNWMDLYLEDFILSSDTPKTVASQQIALEKLQQAEVEVEEAKEEVGKINEITRTEPWCSMVSKKEEDALRNRWNAALKVAEKRQHDAREAMSKISTFVEGQKALMEGEKKLDHQKQLIEWILKQIRTMEIETTGRSAWGPS